MSRFCSPGPVAATREPLGEFNRTSTLVGPVVVQPMFDAPSEPSQTWMGFGVDQMVLGVQPLDVRLTVVVANVLAAVSGAPPLVS